MSIPADDTSDDSAVPPLVNPAIVADIDRAIGRGTFAGLVERHLEGLGRSLALFEAWLADGRWDEMRNEAHRLKGGSGTLGFVRLSRLWGEVEGHAECRASGGLDGIFAQIRLVHGELRGWAATHFGRRVG